MAVITTVAGRQLKLRREAAGIRAGEFGAAVGHGEDLVYKIEGGKRIPRPEYLDKADEVLGAGGLLSAMKEDVEKARYPKKVRALAELEAQAVEIGVYKTSKSTACRRHRSTSGPAGAATAAALTATPASRSRWHPALCTSATPSTPPAPSSH